MKTLSLLFIATTLSAQVQPAPGWCSMAHCNNQMTDFVPQPAFGLSGSVYVKNRDTEANGARYGLACVTNGANFACSYKQFPGALVYYDADGNILWNSGVLLDSNIDFAAPLIQADGSVVIGDDQHIIKFNHDGSVAWSTPSPGGQPTSLVTTPNGAIVSATDQVTTTLCAQNNCQLQIMMNDLGSNYTQATVSFSGGDCPGAAATATITSGQISAITVTAQGTTCIVPPEVLIQGDGAGARASAELNSPTPVAVYNGTTGALVGSMYFYVSGSSGPAYYTTNTPSVNNGSFPNRVYVSLEMSFTPSSTDQGVLWALDIDPTNQSNPIRPAWSFPFKAPSGASPLVVGDNVYFDGSGVTPGDNVGTTIFGLKDNGSSYTVLFEQSLGPGAGMVTSNFALDPRPGGGFWHVVQGNSNIYHRDGSTGAIIESIDTGALITANGAPPGNYWTSGVFTTYGTPDHPYLTMSEHAVKTGAYFAMVDLTNASLVFALPLYPGNTPFDQDSEEGMAALAIDSSGQPIMAIANRYGGAYFLAEGPGTVALSAGNLAFGEVALGSASAVEAFTITNNASTVLNISGVSAVGDFSQTNTCTAPLPPGISCTISVTFSPTAVGNRTGAISITDNAAGSPQSIALSGTGINLQPAISLSSTLLNFGLKSVGGASPAQTVTVTNTGAAPLTFTSIAAGGDASENNSCIQNLPPGASCTINIMFTPKAAGTRTGTITITDSAPGSPHVITMAGTGVPTPQAAAALSTTSVTFLARLVGTNSTAQVVTLSNPGTTALNITSIAASGDAASTTTCTTTLAPGAHCLITVTFTPAAIGPRTGTITVTDSAPDSPQAIAVSGTGLGNAIPLLNQPAAPASSALGGPGFTLTLTGGGFLSGAAIEWNGTPLTTTFAGSSQLTAAVPASALATARAVALTVSNPGPGGARSNTQWFPVSTPVANLAFRLSNLPAGPGPVALAAADFNADGKLDLAVANSAAGTVSILLGNGDGTFAPAINDAAGKQPVAIATGDFNGDGILDLAVVDQAGNAVWILLGSGKATFLPAVPYTTGNGPVAIAVADFNADGALDLIIANRLDNTVSILAGKGDGTFKAHADYPAGQAPCALVASDFNADGKLDLAVGNDFYGGTVSVLLGNGNGTLQPPVAYSTGDSVTLAVADFNGDGILDLTAVNQMEQTLSVLLGNGDGTFQAALTSPTQCLPVCQLHSGPLAMTLGDMNGDGTAELAIVNRGSGTISILQSWNNGSFSPPMDYATAADPVAVVLGDFNGDGAMDVAVAAFSSNTVSILLQAPGAILSSNSLNFGSVSVGASATQTVTLTNSGSAPLHLAGATTTGNFSQTNNCGTSLLMGAACSFTVTFSPATTGASSGALIITDDVPGSPQTIALTGTGVAVQLALKLSSPLVIGGNPLTSNMVTLGAPAPPGGTVVSLQSSNPSVAAVPASVTIASGSATSPAFTVTTTPVSTATSVTLSATADGVTTSATLRVYPIMVGRITLSSTMVTSGLSSNGNLVNLDSNAPAGGALVMLSSANPALAAVPASVIIPAGAVVSPPFTIKTGYVTTATAVVITAQYGKSTTTATLTVNPVIVDSVSLSPPQALGGTSPISGMLILNAPAPPAGALVTLSSSNSAVVSLPASVTVPGGTSTSPAFSIYTTPVAGPVVVTISATYNSVKKSALLTINPATPYAVKLSASTVTGGNSLSGNDVQLNAPAPTGGTTVKLSSSNPAVATVPATILIPAGLQTSGKFTITTHAVTSSTTVSISATYLGVTKSATLAVTP